MISGRDVENESESKNSRGFDGFDESAGHTTNINAADGKGSHDEPSD